MTSPFPFPTRYHHAVTAPGAVHTVHFYSLTDPVLDVANSVTAGKRWRQPDDLDNPTKYKDWIRNEGNTAWLFDGAWGIAEYDLGQVPVADVDGYLWPGDVDGGSGGGPATVDIQDEGVTEGAADTLDFTGSGVSVTFAAGKATVDIPGGAGGTVDIEDEGAAEGAADTIDFVGAGVSVVFAAGKATVTIPGGAGGWTEVVNENGTTFANFTVSSGTWDSNATVIRQTAISASWKSAYLTAKQAVGAGYVLEADVKIISGSSGLRAVGVIIGTSTAVTVPAVNGNLRNNGGTTLANVDRHNTDSPYSAAFSFSEDTFYTIRVVASGGWATLFVDGVLVGGGYVGTAGNGQEATYVALTNYNCEAHYQNILGWRPLLPGE